MCSAGQENDRRILVPTPLTNEFVFRRGWMTCMTVVPSATLAEAHPHSPPPLPAYIHSATLVGAASPPLAAACPRGRKWIGHLRVCQRMPGQNRGTVRVERHPLAAAALTIPRARLTESALT